VGQIIPMKSSFELQAKRLIDWAIAHQKYEALEALVNERMPNTLEGSYAE